MPLLIWPLAAAATAIGGFLGYKSGETLDAGEKVANAAKLVVFGAGAYYLYKQFKKR